MALTALCLSGCAGSSGASHADMRSFTFRYETTIPARAGNGPLEVWVPLPLEDPGVQHVSDLKIEGPSGWKRTQERSYGNSMIHYRVENPSEPVKIAWTAKIQRSVDTGQGQLPGSPRFLLANRLIPLDGTAMDLAKSTGASEEGRPLETRAKAIFDDVLNNMAYDKKHEGWGLGSFEHSVTVCKGNCTDFHSRFIGVGRAAGIPVRFTMGIPMKPVSKGSYNSYHCWAHYYDGRYWHPVDISEADKIADRDPEGAQRFFGRLDPDRISISIGRDLVLAPAQKGPPVNYFVFPYAEQGGKIVPLGKKNWIFHYEDLPEGDTGQK